MRKQIKGSKYRGPLSMTGFGCARMSARGVAVDVEVKAVNGRFLDFIPRLPRVYNVFEQDVRERVAASIERGRIEVSVLRSTTAAARPAVFCNRALVKAYLAAYREGLSVLPASSRPTQAECLRDILSRGDVIQQQEDVLEISQERKLLLSALEAAISQLLSMRENEGQRLVRDITKRTGAIAVLRAKLSSLADSHCDRIQARLQERISKHLGSLEIEPSRLVSEVALLADKADISEELVRIESHLQQFAAELKKTSVGRRLDFLLQELGREFNTIGSKVQDGDMQRLVVDAKAELEKVREQVQNLE